MRRPHTAKPLASMVTLTLAITLALAVGCITDSVFRPQPNGDEPVDVRLHLRTPGGFFAPRTRALSAADENTINNIYVLVFDRNDLLTDVHRGEDVEDNDGSGTGQFTVTLEPSMGGDKSKLVVLANAESILDTRGIIDPADPEAPSGAVGDSYTDIIEDIQAGFTAPFTGSTIPMWGETPEAITIAASTGTQTIELMRSVARIDVGIGTNPAYDSATDSWTWNGKNGTEDIPFDLTGVWIVNPNTAYTLIPAPGNVQNAGDNGRVTAPTTSGTTHGADTDQKAEAFAHTAVTNNHYISRGIYVPEADVKITSTAKPGDDNHNNRMALVIGGLYAGSPTPTYYRIDFATKDDGLLNVLRNHLYQFNISKVSGAGYPSVREAYEASAMNMTVEILRWDEGLITDIWVSGDDYFGIERRSVEFPSYGEPSREVAIKTNVADFTLTMGEKTLTPGGTVATDNFSYSLTKNGGAQDLYTLTITTLGANVSQNAPSPGRLDEWEIAFGIIEGVSFTVSQQWESTYISVANGAAERVFPEGRAGDERIPIDIISSVPVTVTLSSGADSWITGVPASIPSSGGIWSANLQLAITPYKYGTDGTSNRSATITITAGDGPSAETRRMTITQEAPFLSFDLPNVRLDRPATPGPVTRTVMIQTNLPADHLDFTFTDVTGITHTNPTLAGIASRPRYMGYEASIDTGTPGFQTTTTFSVAPKTPSGTIPDYGLTAANGSVTLRAADEVFDFLWRRGSFLDAVGFPWAPTSDDDRERMNYIFPWNATGVEFEVRSNVGITDETIPTDMRGGGLTPGSPTTDATSITTTPYTFTFNNTDRAETQRDFTLLFVPAEPSELTLPVTFSQRGQSWSRGDDPDPVGHTGTGAGAGSFTPLAVTSNIRWQAASSAPTWLTLSLETTGFGTTVARNDRVTTPVLDPADLTKNGPMNIHVDAITELNPAMTDDRRTGTISFTNLDSADGGIALSTEAITITQWAPVLRPKSTTLPTESQQKLPASSTSYTVNATTNLQGWGVRIYSTTSNMGGTTERTPLVAETFGSTPTIDPAAAPLEAGRSLSITIPQYYGFDDRELEFVLWCSGFAGEVPIVSRTQGASSSLRLSPDLVTPFDAADGSSASREITVTANVDWTAELVGTNSNDFLLSADSGSGSGSFTVSPKTANESTVARTATIRVTGTGLTPVERAIAQNGAGASITLDPTEWTFLATQDAETTQAIEVLANVDWTATLLTGGDYFEIVTGTGTGVAGTGSFTVRPKAANKMPTERTATIAVTGTGASKTFTARHAAAEPSIVVLPDAPLTQFLATDGTATTRTVSVTANIPWTATLEGTGAAAFELSQTSGTGTGTETETTFTVSPKKANNTPQQLDANIVVRGTGEHTALSDQVAVSQASSILVTGITINPETVSVYIGSTTTLSATVAPSNATNKSFTWSANPTSVATVTSAGVVTGVAVGTVTITATANDGSGITGTRTVTVKSGGYGDILIFRGSGDGAYLDIGQWGDEINAQNLYSTMAYFKWGSVVGMNNADGFTTFNSTVTSAAPNAVMFNPSNISFNAYAGIPYYDTAPASGDVADASYTSLANVLAGKGDPCRLVGLTVAQIRSATSAQWTTYMNNSQWRMPTDAENQAFINGSVPGGTAVSPSGGWTKDSPGLMTFLRSGNAVLPAAGYQGGQQGQYGYYMSSSVYELNSNILFLDNKGAKAGIHGRDFGFNLRCVLL